MLQEIQNGPPDSQPIKSGHMIANSFLVVRVLSWWCLVELSMNEDVENMAFQKEQALNFDLSEPFPQPCLHWMRDLTRASGLPPNDGLKRGVLQMSR